MSDSDQDSIRSVHRPPGTHAKFSCEAKLSGLVLEVPCFIAEYKHKTNRQEHHIHSCHHHIKSSSKT